MYIIEMEYLEFLVRESERCRERLYYQHQGNIINALEDNTRAELLVATEELQGIYRENDSYRGTERWYILFIVICAGCEQSIDMLAAEILGLLLFIIFIFRTQKTRRIIVPRNHDIPDDVLLSSIRKIRWNMDIL